MKKHILKFAQSNKQSKKSFDALCDGTKKVETRAASPKYMSVREGDVLVFKCGDTGIQRIVKKTQHFENITEMLKQFKVTDIMSWATEKEMREAYDSYTGYTDKLKKYGIMAFEL